MVRRAQVAAEGAVGVAQLRRRAQRQSRQRAQRGAERQLALTAPRRGVGDRRCARAAGRAASSGGWVSSAAPSLLAAHRIGERGQPKSGQCGRVGFDRLHRRCSGDRQHQGRGERRDRAHRQARPQTTGSAPGPSPSVERAPSRRGSPGQDEASSASLARAAPPS